MTAGIRGVLPQTGVADLLVERRLLTRDQRDWVIDVHERTGSPLAWPALVSGSGIPAIQRSDHTGTVWSEAEAAAGGLPPGPLVRPWCGLIGRLRP